jgi:anti-anti-sigma factor
MTTVSPDEFAIVVTTGTDRVVVALAGALDLAAVVPTERAVHDLRRDGARHVVLDLRGLRFVDSQGLGLLLSLRNDAKRNGHALTLVRGPAVVQRVFALTGTRGLFDWEG